MTTTEKLTAFQMLTSDNSLQYIFRVYSGKPGCACGCRGNYRCTKAVAAANIDPNQAYRFTVNEAQVKKVTKIVLENWLIAEESVEYVHYASVELNGRIYTVYFGD